MRDELAMAHSSMASRQAATVIVATTAEPPPRTTGAPAMEPAGDTGAARPVALSIDSPQRREYARNFLAKYRDPAGREELFKDRKGMHRQDYADLGRTLGINNEETDQLIELLVRQDLAMEEAASKCIVETACSYTGVPQDFIDAQEREIAERFGPQTLEDLKFFQRSYNERRTLTELRGRLPDNARLSDAKAKELVLALVDENSNIQADMAKVGYGIAQTNYGAFVVEDADTTGAREAAATDYNRRMVERASGVLSAAQLNVYQQMIDEMVGLDHNSRLMTGSPVKSTAPQ